MIRVARAYTLGTTYKIRNRNSLLLTQMVMATHYNIDFCLFGARSIDIKNMTIDALFMEEGKQVVKTISLPPLVDNSMAGVAPFKKLKDKCMLVQPFVRPSKSEIHKLLESEGTYRDWLIPTTRVKSAEDIKLFLREHNDCIMKSIQGSGGTSVHKISVLGDAFVVLKGHSRTTMTDEQFTEYIDDLFKTGKSRYIVQPFLTCVTAFGEPYDIRLHCRRGKDNKIFVDLMPRIGSVNGVVSNVTSGGYTMPCEKFFVREFGGEAKAIQEKLEKFAIEFTEYFGGFFEERISALPIDVAVVREGENMKFYLFEVNAYPRICRTSPYSDIVNQFDYYKYLYDKYGL